MSVTVIWYREETGSSAGSVPVVWLHTRTSSPHRRASELPVDPTQPHTSASTARLTSCVTVPCDVALFCGEQEALRILCSWSPTLVLQCQQSTHFKGAALEACYTKQITRLTSVSSLVFQCDRLAGGSSWKLGLAFSRHHSRTRR